MENRIEDLIKILFDNTAREDERHDAAMDIGGYNDDKALDALILLASNPNDDDIVLDACGESIGEILVNRDEYRGDIIKKLAPIAKNTAEAFIKHHKPEWFKGSE